MIWKSLKQGTALIPETRKPVAWLALIVIGGIIYFFVAVIILHFLRPEYNPVNHAVSNYAVGPYGYLMTLAFYALALSLLALAFGLIRSLIFINQARVAVLLLFYGVLALVGWIGIGQRVFLAVCLLWLLVLAWWLLLIAMRETPG